MKTVLKGRRFQDIEYINKCVMTDLNAVALDAFDDFFVQLLLKCKKFVADKGDYYFLNICSCRLSPETVLFDIIYIIHAVPNMTEHFTQSAIYYQNLSMFGWNLAIVRGHSFKHMKLQKLCMLYYTLNI
jgi:hypothetical protein